MPAPPITAGSTLLQVLKQPWSEVPIKQGDKTVPAKDLVASDAPEPSDLKARNQWSKERLISTEEFLQACESLTVIFDALASQALDKIVKADILANVGKLRERYLAAPLESATVQELCTNEIKAKAFKATEGFVWLVRTLNFTLLSLKRNVSDKSEELSVSFKQAYEVSLSSAHSWLVKQGANLAWNAVPYRAAFYKAMGDDQDMVHGHLESYLAPLEKVVQILRAFIETEEDIIPKKFKKF